MRDKFRRVNSRFIRDMGHMSAILSCEVVIVSEEVQVT